MCEHKNNFSFKMDEKCKVYDGCCYKSCDGSMYLIDARSCFEDASESVITFKCRKCNEEYVVHLMDGEDLA